MAVQIIMPDGSSDGQIRLVVIGQIAPDATAPTTPTGLASQAGNTQITYTWSASTDNVAVTKYRIRRGVTLIAEPTGTSYILTGLTNGTAVSNVTVSAVDAAGNESAQAALPAATPQASADVTAPSAPTNPTATAGNTQIAYTWTASTDAVGVTGYRIRNGESVLGTSAVASYTATGLANGVAYTKVTVTSYDAAGNESARTLLPVAVPQSAAGTYYATTFDTEPTGAMPATWASQWDTRTVTVEEIAAGQRVLRLAATGSSVRTAITWNTVPNVADVEALARVRFTNAAGADGGLVLRVSGTGTSESGLVAREVTAGSDITWYDNAAAGLYASDTTPALRDGTWYWQRARLIGTTLQYRIWADGASEPSTWELTTDVGTHPLSAGKTGYFRFNFGGDTDVDYYSVGVGGAVAPSPAVV